MPKSNAIDTYEIYCGIALFFMFKTRSLSLISNLFVCTVFQSTGMIPSLQFVNCCTHFNIFTYLHENVCNCHEWFGEKSTTKKNNSHILNVRIYFIRNSNLDNNKTCCNSTYDLNDSSVYISHIMKLLLQRFQMVCQSDKYMLPKKHSLFYLCDTLLHVKNANMKSSNWSD